MIGYSIGIFGTVADESSLNLHEIDGKVKGFIWSAAIIAASGERRFASEAIAAAKRSTAAKAVDKLPRLQRTP